MSDNDYGDFKTKTNDGLLGQIAEAAESQRRIEFEIEEAEEALLRKKAELKSVKEQLLPKLFDEGGLEGILSIQDMKIKIDEKIRTSISRSNPHPAHKWLRENGVGRMIKNQFLIDIDPGTEGEKVGEFVKILEEAKANYTRKESVHHSTLTATIKKLMEDGVDVPKDLFGVFRQRAAKIS